MSARSDLCGWRSAMITPTAADSKGSVLETRIGLLSQAEN